MLYVYCNLTRILLKIPFMVKGNKLNHMKYEFEDNVHKDEFISQEKKKSTNLRTFY